MMAAYTKINNEEMDENEDFIDKIKIHLDGVLNEEHIETFCQIFDNNYGINHLIDDICEAFDQDDKHLTIYKVLNDKLNLTQIKRQQIYDILLHKYFMVDDLNVDNIINLSKTFIIQLKLDNIIDTKTFISIIRKNNLNGKALMELKNARKFADLFKTMNISAKHFSKIYMKFTKWKPKEYEKEIIEIPIYRPDNPDDEKKYNEFEILHCRNDEDKADKDPLPKYMYKSVFDRSEDGTLETLIDKAVLKVLRNGLWKKKRFVKKVYKDSEYYDAVTKMYNEIGGNEFFNQFIKKHLKRELAIWRIKSEYVQTISMDSEAQIFNIVQSNSFDDSDENHD
eukprot:38073_1